MNLEHKRAVMTSFAASDDGRISGYASLFGVKDQGNDVVMPGAYTASLARLDADGSSVKMLWQHDPAQVIGVWDEVREDNLGLFVKGRVLAEVGRGKEAIALMKAKAIDGLSVGYRTVRAMRGESGERKLMEMDLWEVSIVTFPMLPSARATIDEKAVAAMTRRDFERTLTQDAGLSRSVARKLIAGGIEALGIRQDADDRDLTELAELLRRRIE